MFRLLFSNSMLETPNYSNSLDPIFGRSNLFDSSDVCLAVYGAVYGAVSKATIGDVDWQVDG